LLLFVAACVISIAVALSNDPYFRFMNRFVAAPANRPLLRGAMFSSYLLLLSALVMVWRPAFFGLRVGESGRQGRLILGVTLGFAFFTTLVVALIGGTPLAG
jgi:hypothetical protein